MSPCISQASKVWWATIFIVFVRAWCLHKYAKLEHSVLCGQLCHSSTRYISSTECKSCVLSTKMYNHVKPLDFGSFTGITLYWQLCTWQTQGQTTNWSVWQAVHLRVAALQQATQTTVNCFHLCGWLTPRFWRWWCLPWGLDSARPSAFAITMTSVMIMWVWGAVGKIKREINKMLKQCWGLAKCILLTQLFNNSFMFTALANVTNTTFWTWNWQFHLQHKFSIKQLSITDFFGKSDLHTGIKVTFYLFTVFVGLNGKFVILMFLTF